MKWYFILIIIAGALLGLFLLILTISKITKPKFKHVKKYLSPKTPEVKAVKEEQKATPVSSPIGLNFDNVYAEEDARDSLENDEEPDFSGFDFSKVNHKNQQQNKSILEQIRELSPELKMLIFDRGLARKDYDFKSKKD